MPQGIIYIFKTVYIENHDRKNLFTLLGLINHLGKTFEKQSSVGYFRQRIIIGQILQMGFCPFYRGKMAESLDSRRVGQSALEVTYPSKVNLPVRRPAIVRRERLIDHLSGSVQECRVTLINAPAGYGKTSLLIDFAHEADFPVAWYALDEFDNAPHTFLAYLIAAVRVHFPEFGAAALAALQQATDSLASLQSVVALIAIDLYRLPDQLIIVLDDYHVIHHEIIDALVALLIRYGGENCHIFLDSRTLPRIPDQTLLLARGQMDGISHNQYV